MRTIRRPSENSVSSFPLAAIIALAVASSFGSAFAASPIAKAARTKKHGASAKKQAAPAPAVPPDNSIGALSSCKKHVENMLKSPATQFQSDSSFSVVKADAENFDVSGSVRSANMGGQAIGGNFNCHAQLIGGAVWSTRTSLDFAH